MHNSQETANRIKKRAKELNLSVNQLLLNCGLGKNTIDKLAKGNDILTKNFAKIADYLDCSVDYLLGRSEIINNNKEIFMENKQTEHRIKQLRMKKGASQKDIADFLGVDQTVYEKYEKGESKLNTDIISRLAAYFNVSNAYILGETDFSTIQNLIICINLSSLIDNTNIQFPETTISAIKNGEYRFTEESLSDFTKYFNVSREQLLNSFFHYLSEHDKETFYSLNNIAPDLQPLFKQYLKDCLDRVPTRCRNSEPLPITFSEREKAAAPKITPPVIDVEPED